MSGDDDARTGVDEALEGGEGGADTAVIRDVAVCVQRDVEVRANENRLAGEIAEGINGPH